MALEPDEMALAEAKAKLEFNERTRLIAAAYDRASTAFFTVGVLAPVVAAFYGWGNAPHEPVGGVIGTMLFLYATGFMHYQARTVLKGLLP